MPVINDTKLKFSTAIQKDPDLKRTYSSWYGIKQRCNNSNTKRYPRYGGRGIKYTEKWECFENFLEDMGVRPRGMTIERINNNESYCKENCKWATPKEQANNFCRNHKVVYKDKEMTISQFATLINKNYSTVNNRLWNNWTIEEIAAGSRNSPITYDNKVFYTQKELADYLKQDYHLFRLRIRRGWTVEQILRGYKNRKKYSIKIGENHANNT